MDINYEKLILLLRTKLNISQQDLAKRLEVSYSSISRWERGINKPTKLIKIKLIKLLKENSIELEEINNEKKIYII